jgi:hypothetical protein
MGLEKEKAHLIEKEKLTKKEKTRLTVIENRIPPLKQFMADADAQRTAVKGVGMS